MVREKVKEWQQNIWKKEFPYAQFGPLALLKNKTLNVIASVGPIQSVIELEKVLDEWTWFGKYGDSLLELLKSLPIPPMIPISKEARASKGTKQKATQDDGLAERGKGKKKA